MTLDLHHRIYIAFCAVGLSVACALSWYGIETARETVLTMRALRDPRTGLQAQTLKRVDEGFALVDAQISGIRRDVFGPDGERGAVGAIRDAASIAIREQAAGLRYQLFGTNGTSGAVGVVRDEAVSAIAQQGNAAVGAIQSLQVSLEQRIDRGGDFISVLLNDPEKGIVPPVLSIVRIVNRVAVDHLMEKGNHASWPADITGLLRSLELAMGSVEKAAAVISAETPGVTKDVHRIADDATREADQLTKPQSFWGSLRSWALVLARIYAAVY